MFIFHAAKDWAFVPGLVFVAMCRHFQYSSLFVWVVQLWIVEVAPEMCRLRCGFGASYLEGSDATSHHFTSAGREGTSKSSRVNRISGGNFSLCHIARLVLGN